MRRAVLWMLVGLSVAACFMKRITAESSFSKKGLARASFDLSCPAQELTTTVLNRNDGLGCAGSVMGVSGCGRKATYVCTRQQDWILNGTADEDTADAADSPQVAK